MDIIMLTIGVIFGIIATKLFTKENKIYGVIEVDHDTQQCRFRITSDELANRTNKKAVFVIEHDVHISRDEQSL